MGGWRQPPAPELLIVKEARMREWRLKFPAEECVGNKALVILLSVLIFRILLSITLELIAMTCKVLELPYVM